ncbi:MAG: trypsin-like serine protease [Myxococcota bacterium]
MRMSGGRLPRALIIITAGLGGSSCTAPESDPTRSTSSPIVNGALDTTHDAVVAWLHGSKCSATIIAVDGNTGYALTAAHCLGPPNGTLRQGPNHNQAERTYDVVEQAVHPRYAEASALDFAMLRFTGADANTPTMEVLTPAQDTMVVGSTVTMVGYGITPQNNSRRRFATNTLTGDLTNDVFVSYDQSQGQGGVCSGDSGGPSLYAVGGTEYVAAVHSFVTQGNFPTCEGLGVSSRASGVLDSFIQPFIDGTAFGLESCEVCRDAHIRPGAVASCGDPVIDCFQENDCLDYNQCLRSCPDEACRNACGQDNPNGKAVFDGIDACVCSTACSVECNDSSRCEPDPVCWLEVEDDTCQSCLEGACCAEAGACAAESACLACAEGDATDGCDAVPTFAALTACLETSCDEACSDWRSGDDDDTGAGGGGDGTGAAGGGPTVPTSPGGDASANDDDDGDRLVPTSGCRIGGAPIGTGPAPSSVPWWIVATGLAVAATARRRRARPSRRRIRSRR